MRLDKISVNSDWLKITALILMTTDHIAKIFSLIPLSDVLQLFGSIVFPMFSFILMYHLYKYQIYKKYLIRLGIFAALTFLIMQLLQVAGVNTAGVPFNILYMFFICVLALMLKKIVEDKIKNSLKKNLAVCLVYIFCGALVCRLSLFAFAYIILIYCFFEKPSKITFIMLLVFAYLVYLGGIEGIVALVASALLANIDYDEKHPRIIKRWYVFYVYYPLHLGVLLLIRMYVQ